LQDNSSWQGYSSVNLANKHWKNLYGGDGFWVQPDPTDPDYVYAESQGGNAGRINTKTMTSRSIKPEEAAGEAKYRWNWNTPIQLSPTDKSTLYMGAQYLFRSRDKGNSWEKISPDLTTNDPKKQNQEESGGLTVDNSSAETHCTIYSISESPKNGKVIWVGTDDGNLQLTRDGGKSWTNLRVNVPGLPKDISVSWIEAGPYAEGTAFVTFDGHTFGDMKPYVYRTDDFGKTWTSLITSDLSGYAHVVKQDPIKPNLFYLGTEFGLFISVDAGKNWARFKGGEFPPVAVRDIAIHPREQDLVLATHGRGIWIIDDLTPLRGLTPEVLSQNVALLPTRPAVRNEKGSDGWMDGDAEYVGDGPIGGAPISYWQKKRHLVGDLKIDILDANGKLLQSLPGDKRRGFASVTWNRTLKAPRSAAGTNIMDGLIFNGPEALEGVYTARLTKGKDMMTTKMELQADPDSPSTRQDREAKYNASMVLFGMVEDLAFRADQVKELRDAAQARAAEAKDETLKKRLETFAARVESERGKLVSVKETGGAISGEDRLREKLTSIYRSVTGQPGRPSPAQLSRIDALKADLATAFKAVDALTAKELPTLNADLQKASLPPLSVLDQKSWDEKTKK
jgi:hypothetical protein